MSAAQPLPESLPSSLPDYLPARMVNEFVYCPRLFFYEWVEGLFAHSADTVEGALRHETLGEKAEGLRPAGDDAPERIHSTSVSLSSDSYGLIAVIDLVEGGGGSVSPVDYKHGAPREQDGVLEAAPPGVPANDSHPDSLPFTAVLGQQPTYGIVTLASDGSFSYTPAAGFAGTDSFTYFFRFLPDRVWK